MSTEQLTGEVVFELGIVVEAIARELRLESTYRRGQDLHPSAETHRCQACERQRPLAHAPGQLQSRQRCLCERHLCALRLHAVQTPLDLDARLYR
jgi:hypothetical protein